MVTHIHLVSDSTGETVHNLARACLVQFEEMSVQEHSWPLIRTISQIEKFIESLKENPGIVFYTLVDASIRKQLDTACHALNVPAISVLDPIISALSDYLGAKTKNVPGQQHLLDEDYFKRIDAMQYALNHDDGQGLHNLNSANVILVGVSRTSKSPTCLYLANRGIKAANIPIVPNIDLPNELLFLKNKEASPLIIGLTADPEQLVQIRRSRLQTINEKTVNDYANFDNVKKEIRDARRLFTKWNWPVIDVSRRSIEETAAAILQYLEHHIN